MSGLNAQQVNRAKTLWSRMTAATERHPATTTFIGEYDPKVPAERPRALGYLTTRQLFQFLKELNKKWCLEY